MTRRTRLLAFAILLASSFAAPAEDALAAGFAHPPAEARTRAFW